MLLATQNLTKNFGGLTAVSNLDFTAKRGEIMAIIGPNGAGKTTFFNLLSGVYRPSAGKVYFNGEDITGLPPHRRAQKGIARTFQTTTLFTEATVFDNVLIGHRVRTTAGLWDALSRNPRYRRDEKACWDKAWEVLEFTGLTELAKKPVASISQEAKKRAAIALALATDPQLILLDEPAAGINFDETEGIANLIKKMQQKGLTICLIEHKMRMVLDVADRISVLNYGTKIAEGPPEEIVTNPAVIEAYLGGANLA
ncbi:leucine/isoleucine/valine transporter ATP-binding subunit [Clostridiales bacterium PH28_bin88]|nr:leucine/isoleucine/valine transporter ATP-binding subunit [Clostridiales bacterium PH28_bin88]